MTDFLSTPCAAFAGVRLIARGRLADVALAAKATEGEGDSLVIFDEKAGEVIDLDLRGGVDEIVQRLAARAGEGAAEEQRQTGDGGGEPPRQGRGRPRLGVVAREVTLLPRHWQWLSAQPGGASQALRRLVDQARRTDAGTTEARARRDTAYTFMAALAGDLPGFEEATRALFAGDRGRLEGCMAGWPVDVGAYALDLAFGGSGG